mgnify:FL=1
MTPTPIPSEEPAPTSEIIITNKDLNGDGKLDKIIIQQTGNIDVYFRQSDETYIQTDTYDVGPGLPAPESVNIGDFNNDQKIDIMVFTKSIGIVWFKGLGNGIFDKTPYAWTQTSSSSQSTVSSEQKINEYKKQLELESKRLETAKQLTELEKQKLDALKQQTTSNEKISSGIVQEQPRQINSKIPDWVRSNAGWWSQDMITDQDFSKGVEFLIKEKIIIVDIQKSDISTTRDVVIPGWIKNNAEWWSQDLITDEAFASGLEYLIKNGIISVY